MSHQFDYLRSSTNSKRFCTTSPLCSCDMLWVLVAGSLPLRSAESCWVSHAWFGWIWKPSKTLLQAWFMFAQDPTSVAFPFFQVFFSFGKRSKRLHLAACRIGSLLWVPFTKPVVACQVLRHCVNFSSIRKDAIGIVAHSFLCI